MGTGGPARLCGWGEPRILLWGAAVAMRSGPTRSGVSS